MDTNCRAGGSKNRTVKDPSRNQCLLCLVCLRTLLVRIRVTMATTATRAIATMAIATTVMATKMAMGWKWTASACHVSYSCVVDGWCGIGNCWKAEPCLAGHTLESFCLSSTLWWLLAASYFLLVIIYVVSTILIKRFCINLSAQKRYKIWPPDILQCGKYWKHPAKTSVRTLQRKNSGQPGIPVASLGQLLLSYFDRPAVGLTIGSTRHFWPIRPGCHTWIEHPRRRRSCSGIGKMQGVSICIYPAEKIEAWPLNRPVFPILCRIRELPCPCCHPVRFRWSMQAWLGSLVSGDLQGPCRKLGQRWTQQYSNPHWNHKLSLFRSPSQNWKARCKAQSTSNNSLFHGDGGATSLAGPGRHRCSCKERSGWRCERSGPGGTSRGRDSEAGEELRLLKEGPVGMADGHKIDILWQWWHVATYDSTIVLRMEPVAITVYNSFERNRRMYGRWTWPEELHLVLLGFNLILIQQSKSVFVCGHIGPINRPVYEDLAWFTS